MYLGHLGWKKGTCLAIIVRNYIREHVLDNYNVYSCLTYLYLISAPALLMYTPHIVFRAQ